ncbi:MAG: hypothetical protein U9R34_01020 [Nanoarchaeota archaeon]|nr:hypothetical protein [Nanoarchaeota archaeon]
MTYLSNLGIEASEKQISDIFISGTNSARPFNSDLDCSIYQNFVREYSIKRRNHSMRDIFGIYYSPEGGLIGSNKMEELLTHMYKPIQDQDIITRRQDLVKHFANATKEESNLMLNLLSQHSSLDNIVNYEKKRDDKKSRHFPKMVHPFMELADSLSQLSEMYKNDSLMKDFSRRIDGLFEEHPVLKDAYLFDWKSGRVLMNPKCEVSLAKLSLKGTSSINIGLFDDGINYSVFGNYIPDIERFAHECAPFIYTLGSFFYLAKAFDIAGKNDQPVCMPKINNEGIFELREALPIVTRIEGNSPINVEFSYARGNNKVILSGPHSGGKTELLKNIGVYHALALSGFFVPAEYANVPMTRRIITSFKKSAEKNKGSLESEINETSKVIRELQQGDLALWDEFLDTTKPELAAYLEEPLLEGFASTPATIILVSHRATSLRQDFGFRFMYPELKEIEVPEENSAYYIRSEKTEVDSSGFKEGENKIKLLIPTRRFIEGKPTPELTRNHAFQMWDNVKKRLKRGYW